MRLQPAETPRGRRRRILFVPWFATGLALTIGPSLAAAPPREITVDPAPPPEPIIAPQPGSQPPAGSKEIVIDATPPPQKLDALQQLAYDGALLAGATEVGEPVRLTTRDHGLEREFAVQAGRCYFVSVAYSVGFKMHIRFGLGPGLDDRPLSEGLSSGEVVVGPGRGVAHFCFDRPGSVSLRMGLDVFSQDMHRPIEYATAIGWRPETPAQVDARRRAVARGETTPG